MSIQIRPAMILETSAGVPLPESDIHRTEQEPAGLARPRSPRVPAPFDTFARAMKEGA
jgi:hypothetical protein